MRRALLQFVAPKDPQLAAEARRLARAWIGDRSAIDPGLVDAVLVVAARTGDATLFDALLAEAKTTPDRLDRRNLTVALLAFTEPSLARKGMGILLDPDFDIRESGTALWNSFWSSSTRRETHEFIVTNFDALANRVSRDAPGGWPHYASGLCSDADRADVAAFWKDRAAKYAGGERELAQALESIQLCTRLRSKYGNEVAAFLRVT